MGDLIILAVMLLSTYLGAKKGFLRSLTGMLSTLISFGLTMVLFKPIGKMLNNSPIRESVFNKISDAFEKSDDAALKFFSAVQTDGIEAVTDLAIDLISFVVVIIVVKLLLALILRVVRFTVKMPLIKQLNSLLGGAFGFLGGVLICYILIGITEISAQSGMLVWLTKAFENSFLSAFFYRTDFLMNIFKK